MIAEVIVSSNVKNLNKVFDYNIPEKLENSVAIGSRVLIPFGKGKSYSEGIVVNIKEKSEYGEGIKDIAKIEEESLSHSQIKLAKWMSKRYFSNISECMKLMLKPGTTAKDIANRVQNKKANFVYLTPIIFELKRDYPDKEFKYFVKSEKQQKVIIYLIERIFQNIDYNLYNLNTPEATNNLNATQEVKDLNNVNGPDSGTFWGNQQIQDEDILEKLYKLDQLDENNIVLKNLQSSRILQSQLIEESNISRAVMKTLEKNGFIKIQEENIQRNPIANKNILKTNNLYFTEEQQKAFDKINENIDSFGEYLIYGVTGSGKTEIYLQLIQEVLKKGKDAIVLVPEISLTPQMINRFISRFGKEIISVIHSKLSVGERHDSWEKMERGEAKIVIGARSAIFSPMQNLGIIIIDEEHDSSYKSDMAPRYNAKEVAEIIAKENNIPLVLGSATPDLLTFYRANLEAEEKFESNENFENNGHKKNEKHLENDEKIDDNENFEKGKIQLLKLSKRANNSSMPIVSIVDLKQELATGNRTMISRKLYNAIKENLKNKKQTILFLNRRGFSTFIMCRNCGYVAKCNNCNISLTYHRKENKLKCHYCGFEERIMTICPECKSNKIRYFGSGTQKLEDEISKFFPTATKIRMDIDTVTKKNSHEEILKKFNDEKIDILIGTQMIVKGHHFPNVTLVGVISADGSLNIDDYRASERTFDLLVQVAGRAGREHTQGLVIIQTYNPDDYSIRYAKEQNYEVFYNSEILLRKGLRYPPFCDIIMCGISGENEEDVQNVANNFHQYIKEKIEELEKKDLSLKKDNNKIQLMQAMPAPIDKIKNRYRWRIIIKANLSNDLIEILNDALYEKKINKKNVRVIMDINPTNMM